MKLDCSLLPVKETHLKTVWGTPVKIECETAQKTIYMSADRDFAEVDENGVVTPKRTGTAYIIAQIENEPDSARKIRVDISSKTENINGVTYINGILIANKTFSLPKDFGKVNEKAEAALQRMTDDAKKCGVHIFNFSGFRDYENQYGVYWTAYDKYGEEYAERSIARPGFSEHQTGLAFDINCIDEEFEDTAEGIWCRDNAHKYGFILRYPKGKPPVTGYKYAPWHFRYVGDEAESIYRSGLTLEEYLGVDSKYVEPSIKR